MSGTAEDRTEGAAPTPAGGRASGNASPAGADDPVGSVDWIDAHRRRWHIELAPRRIVLRSGDDTIELPESQWARDVYLAEHGSNVIVRIETFESTVGFVVSHEAATPLLAHLGRPREPNVPATVAEEVPPEPERVLWPRVSPLAVWALISSALVFVPVLGLIPAVVTIILLILHRRYIRRAGAWHHSRVLCVAAFVLLIAGLSVSALATWAMLRSAADGPMAQFAGQAGQDGRNWGVIVGGIFVVLLSLSVHEAAHATTAWWLGDGLARSMGRVTLNPLAHIDPIGTVLLPLILVLMNGPVFGYARPVPVRVESLPRHRRAHILISLAGPGSNLLLAAVSLMILLTLGCLLRLVVPGATVLDFSTLSFTVPVSASGFALAPVVGPLCTILKLSFVINVVLAVFNLIPIPPLDGSWVLEHLFPGTFGRILSQIRPYGFLIFIAAIYAGLFEYLAYPIGLALAPGFALLVGCTGL